MARIKCPPEPSITTAEVSDVAKKVTQSQRKDEDVKEESDLSDPESLPSPTVSKTTKVVTKRAARKSTPAQLAPTSPAVTSSSATTPQPEQGPKRKGGNKRKWTHEYCLTCTRYGRACGGRRGGEEGCAVCRDPDRSKGEKLRECLWADHEAGITDYKTAREIFKKAQAEARARKVRPQSKRRQSSNAQKSSKTPRHSSSAIDSSALASAYSPADDLPRTSKPLDLQPPALERSSYSTQERDEVFRNDDNAVTLDPSQLAMHRSVANIPPNYLPHIHRPHLSWVSVDSDGEEKTVTNGQGARPGMTAREHQRHKLPVPYFDASINSWVSPLPVRAANINSSHHYDHPYDPSRSAYDNPPAPPEHLVSQADDGHQDDHRLNDSPNARTSTMPSCPSLDKSSNQPRKWSAAGSRVTSFSGYGWKTKGWKPAQDLEHAESMEALGGTGSRAIFNNVVSDTSSLSSYMSIDEDIIDGAATGGSHVMGLGIEGGSDVMTSMEGNNIDGINRPTNPLKRKYDAANPKSAGPSPTQNRINNSAATTRQPLSFIFQGEITIQQDEEAGTDNSDSELSSDEGKLKSLPAKLRKVLSRSRVTKVIIGDDVFEVRPRSRPSSANMQKEPATARTQAEGRKRVRKRSVQMAVANPGDESDEVDHDVDDRARARDEELKARHPPLKIRLIVNRKSAGAEE